MFGVIETAELVEDFGSDFSNILFTDEPRFYLSGEASSLNGAVWIESNVNPPVRVSKRLHNAKLTFWVGLNALNRGHVTPPYLFMEVTRVTRLTPLNLIYARTCRNHIVPLS